jgi:hypothetical protein
MNMNDVGAISVQNVGSFGKFSDSPRSGAAEGVAALDEIDSIVETGARKGFATSRRCDIRR